MGFELRVVLVVRLQARVLLHLLKPEQFLEVTGDVVARWGKRNVTAPLSLNHRGARLAAVAPDRLKLPHRVQVEEELLLLFCSEVLPLSRRRQVVRETELVLFARLLALVAQSTLREDVAVQRERLAVEGAETAQASELPVSLLFLLT